MKRAIVFAACTALVLSFSACASESGGTESSTAEASAASVAAEQPEQTEQTASEPQDDGIVYQTPADFKSIDLTAEDPSADDLTFAYDDQGRISNIYYVVDGVNIGVSYNYNDDEGTVQILAFSGDTVAADETFTLGEYDPEGGFTEHEGYYFKGYSFD